MTKIGFVSLGCAKNRVDTEVMLHKLVSAGYEITPEEEQADIIIVNTCAFIEEAKQESIDCILDLAWLKKNRALKGIVVCGCLAERYGGEIFSEMPEEADAVVGVGSLADIVEAVRSVENGKEGYISHKNKEEQTLGGDRIITTEEYTAYLKISEGCDNRCTYCAIPLIRGKMRSRPIEDIVEEAKELEAAGVKELNIIAQDTSRYGLDLYGEYSLARLLRAISDATNIPWIRILYMYPDKITDELIEEIANNPRILKYIDLPIQHISNKVLRVMNRHGDSDTIRDAIRRLRAGIPDITLRTTVIVGFPGETEDDFEELCNFIRITKFDRLGAFVYSREEDTAAYDLPDQIDAQLKQDRYDKIMRIQLGVSEKRNKAFIGKRLKVLCEGYDVPSGVYTGRSACDAPDVDGRVFFSSEKKIPAGQFVEVEITECMDYDLVGRAITEKTKEGAGKGGKGQANEET